jgi:choline dehydrogenase
MYDYIVIGAGSAGCVLANRLTESGKFSVCLLEAGPRDTNPLIRMPFGIISTLRSSVLNWKFSTSPQVNCNNRELFWPRGKTLGGSSAINAMCYIRGTPLDYNHWAELGNRGWSYNEVLPYFKKLENFEVGVDAYHAQGGPLNVAKHRHINKLSEAFIEAGKQAGYILNSDFNGKDQDGVGFYHIMQINGERCSNARAYLEPVASRKNLKVITDALAVKILLEGKTATGVRYSKSGREYDIPANKEVILAAGTIGSPQLLLLSGVGPAVEINKHSIPLAHDLPGVGENLQDHLDITIVTREKTRHSISLNPASWWRFIKGFMSYIFYRKGELTTNYAEAGGFIRSDASVDHPDLQWHFVPTMESHHAQDLRNVFYYYGYLLRTCLLKPYSRGRITLRDANPNSPPIINPNYLADDRDLERLVLGFKMARAILGKPAFGPFRLSEFHPGEHVQTDDHIKDYIRMNAETIYHPVGTCKMGDDDMAVVDAELKVRGIKGLRVVDASIMPTIISGNTNAAITMIAEKAADMILNSKNG